MSKHRNLEALVRAALEEDIGERDITTEACVPVGARCEARLIAKQEGVLSGIAPYRLAFELARAEIRDWWSLADGTCFKRGDLVAKFRGNTRPVLTAERTALNFVQHLSGIATLTSQYVALLEGLDCKVCSTRKTTPLLRSLEKAAVVHGGGAEHRFNLFNGILIKENHITAAGSIREAVVRARAGAHHLLRVEVEARTLEEFDQALESGADVILLDNMDLGAMREAVRRAQGRRVVLEASGNATLDRLRGMAETGVQFISVGALTHSAPAVDLSLLIDNVEDI